MSGTAVVLLVTVGIVSGLFASEIALRMLTARREADLDRWIEMLDAMDPMNRPDGEA